MRDYPYSATGVGRWTTTSETAYSGYAAKKRFDRRRNNTSCFYSMQLVIASNRSNASPQRRGEGGEEVGPMSCESERRMADQRYEHVIADVESTRLETKNSEQLHPCGGAEISRNLYYREFR